MKRVYFVCLFLCLTATLLFSQSKVQTSQPAMSQAGDESIPSDPGMYVQIAGGYNKILGQIVSFARTGSLFASGVTFGIKARKENVQLLGPHALTIVGGKPVFYFIPPKQAADAGVNAGDFVLIRLEEKAKRRQFEIGAQGAWRASSGISITHQIQLSRSEERPGIYTITPAFELGKGEYALYLVRGEGMQAYVYDFSVSSFCCAPSRHPDKGGKTPMIPSSPTAGPTVVTATNDRTPSWSEATAEISSDPGGADIEIDGNFVGSTPSSMGLKGGEHTLRLSKPGYKKWDRTLKTTTGNIRVVAVLEPTSVAIAGTAENHPDANQAPRDDLTPSVPSTVETSAVSTGGQAEELVGVWFAGSPTVRRDGIEIAGVQSKGPADNIDIKPGDIILSIDGHYFFTIAEVRAELLRHKPGERLAIRYRHNRLTSENYITLGSSGAVPRR